MLTRTDRRRFPILLAAIAALLVFIAVDAASSPVQAQTPSADASLSSLSLSDSMGDAIELSPTFSTETTSYTASVDSDVSSTTVTAETTDDAATAVITINGVEDADGTGDLVPGLQRHHRGGHCAGRNDAADLYRHRSSGTAR